MLVQFTLPQVSRVLKGPPMLDASVEGLYFVFDANTWLDTRVSYSGAGRGHENGVWVECLPGEFIAHFHDREDYTQVYCEVKVVSTEPDENGLQYVQAYIHRGGAPQCVFRYLWHPNGQHERRREGNDLTLYQHISQED